MKKIALLTAILMVVAAAPGWCGISATADTFIDNRMNSDLHPVADAGRLLDATNKATDKTYHAIMDPLEPGMKYVRKVKDGAGVVINKTWDVITLRHMRDDK